MSQTRLRTIIFLIAMAAQKAFAAPQDRPPIIDIVSPPVAFESSPDTVAAPAKPVKLDSASLRFRFNIDAGYRKPPVHPYFRDDYRLIQDMRRLLHFIDHRKIHGYESVAELFAIARRLPKPKQTEILRVAVAGSLANFASEITSRELREKKVRFVQWELEKVVFRSAFQFLQANVYNGVNAKGLGVCIPRLRLSYSRHLTTYDMNESVIWWPRRRLAFIYTRFNGRPIITPLFASRVGNFAVSYDREPRIITSGFELRRAASTVIRLVHVNHLKFPRANYMRGEVMLRW
jgi:hypothetical protein